jgi:hypothetical protein
MMEIFKADEKLDHLIELVNKLLLNFSVVLYSKDKQKLIAVIESLNSFIHPFEI